MNTEEFMNNIEPDTTRVLIQDYMAERGPYGVLIEDCPIYGKIQVCKSVIILNEGIIINICENFKMRISKSNKNEKCCDLMLMNSENKFIDLIISGYSRSVPKIIDISNLEEEIASLLLTLPIENKFFK